MKPIISLFKTPNGYYFFDTNKDEVVSVGKEAFECLKSLLSDDEAVQLKTPPELLEYKTQGYLKSKSVVEEVKHVYTDHLDIFLERKLLKLTLQLTQACNLRCKYCVYSEENNERQRGHSHKKMSWETAKKAVDFLREHSIDSQEVNIGFYGGEPLLEYNLLKRIVEYSNRSFVGKKLTYVMTSNGTLLTDEMIAFLKENKITLMISLDGPKEINDINRIFMDGSGSFEVVAEKINRVKEIAPDFFDMLQINTVLDPKNDFDCINELHLEGSDFQKLSISASLIDTDYSSESLQFTSQYVWKMEYQRFLAVLSHYGRYNNESISPISNSWISRLLDDNARTATGALLRPTDVPSGPCIPGQMRLFVNVDGLMFPCERVSETSPAMCIGSLDDGFDITKARSILNIGALTESECKKCWCFRYCGMCVNKADNGSDCLSAEVKLSYCSGVRRDVYEKIRAHILFNEIPKCYATQIRGGQ
jgi:uncharacterized protein